MRSELYLATGAKPVGRAVVRIGSSRSNLIGRWFLHGLYMPPSMRPRTTPYETPLMKSAACSRRAAYVLAGIAAGVPRRIRPFDLVIPMEIRYYEPASVYPDRISTRTADVPVPEFSTQRAVEYRPRELSAILSSACARFEPAALPRNFSPDGLPTIENRDRIILTGDKFERSSFKFLQPLIDADERVIALDMESYGFSRSVGEPWMILRGISDLGKIGTAARQRAAALVAAAAARDLIEQGAFSVK